MLALVALAEASAGGFCKGTEEMMCASVMLQSIPRGALLSGGSALG